MKLLPFLSILFLSLCACSEQNITENSPTGTRSHQQEDNSGITITIDTTLQDTILYTF